jgi:dihydrofolate reductase
MGVLVAHQDRQGALPRTNRLECYLLFFQGNGRRPGAAHLDKKPADPTQAAADSDRFLQRYKNVKSSNKPTKGVRIMGKRNYLIEGVSGTGKTSVCQELRRRGYLAINGDRELRYQGDPTTGEKTEGVSYGLPTFLSPEISHAHNIWDVEKVRRLAANQDDEATFFCGGSRNFKQFIDLFDEIFILDVDVETLNERLDSRPDDDWGKSKSERELILRLHATKEDIPSSGIVIDATQLLVSVVDEILAMSELRLDCERAKRLVRQLHVIVQYHA